MYENEIYSGSDAGTHTAGRFSGTPLYSNKTEGEDSNMYQTGPTANVQNTIQTNGPQADLAGNGAAVSGAAGSIGNSGDAYRADVTGAGMPGMSESTGSAQNAYRTDGLQTGTEGSIGNAGSVEEFYQQQAAPEVKEKKTGFFQKALLSVSMGLLFGIFAGVGFYAVWQGTGIGKEEPSQVISEGTVNTWESSTGDNAAGVRNITYVSSDISDVVESVMPAMVSIINNYTETSSFWGRTWEDDYSASGSGIIVSENDKELLIVTNQHVVSEANSLEVTFIDGSKSEALIKGTDSEMDLAVIAVSLDDLSEETRNAITVATLGDSDSLKLGEPVIAIGNALGYGQSVTNGIVSALDREVQLEDGSTGTFIQTNAAINPGNSGGALLNIEGEVIGINSNKYIDSYVEGMGYAIPITSASPIIAELMERQVRSTKVAEADMGYIGIELQEVTSQISRMYNMPQGIYVVSTLEGGAAEAAGVITGDIITKFDGERITSYEDLQNTLQYYAAGDSIKITVMRPENGRYVSYDLDITLGRRPAASN